MNNEEKVISIIKQFLGSRDTEVEVATRIEDLDFDSLDLLEFQMQIDDEFSVEIEVDSFLDCSSVGDIVALVESYTQR